MTEIFYYSGTGYTLAAAKILSKELEGDVKLTPIIGAMRKGNTRSEAEVIGLLMPMHAFGIPLAYKEFLKKLDIAKVEYVFSLVTRGGSPVKMHKEINRHLKRNKKRLDAFQYATAPNTFDPIYEVHTTPEMAHGRSNFDKDVAAFANIINQRKNAIDIGIYRNYLLEYTVFPILKILNRATGYFKLQDSFYSDNKCTGCGQCEKMCLSGKISMQDNKPSWNKDVDCQFCLACLHLCPSKAVQVSNSKTATYIRMAHPDAKPYDIAAQK